MKDVKEPTIHDQTNLLPKRRLLVVFPALACALLITYIDQQSIGVMLPTIGRDLDCASTIVWAGTSSLIANTAFQVLYGRLSDIWGRKYLLLGCLGLLALGDLLCGFAKTGTQLYVFRGVSGVANGGIMALVMMIVSDVTTLEQRGKYQGILGSCVGLGNSIGPFVAAAFTGSKATWRSTFYLIAPLAVLVAVLLFTLLPPQAIPANESWRAKLGKVDYWGIAFSAAGTIILLVPISGLGTQFAVRSAMVIAMLTVGAVLLVLFVVNEWRWAKLPMFPLRLFRNMALAAMLVQNFLIGIVFYSLLYYLPIYFQTARQYGRIASAALVLPIVVPQAIASAASGQYISRRGRYGEVIWLGYGLWTLGTALQCLFARHGFPIAGVAVVLAIEGLGVGLVFQPTLVAAQAHSPKQDRAVVISARNFIRALGGSAGLAIASAVFSNTLLSSLPVALPESVRDSIQGAIFAVPDLTSVADATLREGVFDAYSHAFRNISILWAAAMGTCLLLMVLIKDKGLARNVDEKKAQETAEAAAAAAVVEGEASSTDASETSGVVEGILESCVVIGSEKADEKV
ncbi:hypothetical protein SBRCBS47491_003148 [Sporothrix bragantina]|uniref:Major facilitator superfamily (MFS) profile domain-containing protein n=1 Tax=Sporothrix bragantina TaxID=671064 RepID=A0ABP0BCM8_9PEZI